jgi:CheY-like chemotaxis protein
MLSNKFQSVILVVEDDEFIQDLIERYLSPLDVELYFARNGLDGVKTYVNLLERGKRPEIVIMDINLPVKDGIETTRDIVTIDPDAVIYGFTAFYNTEKAQKLREAGAQKIIPRSVGFARFKSIIERSLVPAIVTN